MEYTDFSSSHPPLPPISEEDLLTSLRLLRSRRVGPSAFYRLLAEHGSPSEALKALPQVARAAGASDYSICPEGVAVAELRQAKRAGARAIWRGDASYPPLLAEITDAPPLLWARGPLDLATSDTIGVVGARNASSLGTRMTRRLVSDLAGAGFVIVSGLARGIDTVAHKTSTETGTVAVVAGGVDIVYPSENADLMDEIAATGLVLSEMPMGIEPRARHFPRRNRIIAGLSRALLVVEAAAKSGSLITAGLALDQGRDVLAVPGHPFDARAAGSNGLIRDGATLVRHAEDVFEALERPVNPQPQAPDTDILPEEPNASRDLREVAALHQQVLDRLGPSPLAEDQLIRDCNAPASEVASALLDLEMDGAIERQTGGFLTRKSA